MADSSGYFVAMAGDTSESQRFRETVFSSMKPFFGYLDKAINNLEKKEIKCCWKPLESNGWKLSSDTKVFKIQPLTKVRIIWNTESEGWFTIDASEFEDSVDDHKISANDDVSWGKGTSYQSLRLEENHIKWSSQNNLMLYLGNVSPTSINWKGYELKCSPAIEKKIDLSSDFFKNGTYIKIHNFDEDILEFESYLTENDKLEINGTQLEFKILNQFDKIKFEKEYPQAISENDSFVLILPSKPTIQFSTIRDITDSELKSLSISDLSLDDKPFQIDNWDYLANENKLCSVSDTEIKGKLCHKNLNWELKYKKINSDNWIQLIDFDDTDSETVSREALEYFFDENVSIHLEKTRTEKSKLYIMASRPEEFQILLSENKQKRKSVLPTGDFLYLKPDMGELINQKKALRFIEEQPFPENLPLLQLMENRELQKWATFNLPEIPDEEYWKVLTNPNYDGCDKQRKFVQTAISTPDFAILDGPPGTGKTTTILELIIQLSIQKKRILLAASTNAAINNVLERLRDSEFIERYNIYPTRLGQEEKAINVEEFVLDNQIKKFMEEYNLEEDEAKHLIIESSNLVCGTTNGIHRLFNTSKAASNPDFTDNLTRKGIPFDVMIIDECSKTTFQEFLVPARLSKRWILVGDVKQLSPFTDREQIETNLDEIEGMNDGLREACFLLHHFYPFKERVIVPVSKETMNSLQTELSERNNENKGADSSPFENVLLVSNERCELIELYNSNVIFIEENLMKKCYDWLPKDAFLVTRNWMAEPHSFKYFSKRKWPEYNLENCNNKSRIKTEEKYCSETVDSIFNRTWAMEVCWRLEREYWLRTSKNSSELKRVQNGLSRLFPKISSASNVRRDIYRIRNMSFPSILESLSTHGMDINKFEKTTLNSGFHDKELKCRLVTLTHQHRMHSEISEAPRELFYKETRGVRDFRSLLDGKEVDQRDWLQVYPHRNIWIGCKGNVDKNSNGVEADRIIKEIKSFCEKNYEKKYEIAILTFYKGQEKLLREKLQLLPEQKTRHSNFNYKGNRIKLATVDFFQGQEADIVYLSMVNTTRDGFLDTPNRLNVAITRARHQMVIVGNYEYFHNNSRSYELKSLAKKYHRVD